MKITASKDILLKSLSRIQGIVEKISIKPITSNALITAAKSEVIVSATNLQIGMTAKYNNIKIHKEGKISVNAKKIFEIIKEMPDKDIIITESENYRIEIKCGEDLKFNINGLPPEDFPMFLKEEENNFIKWNTEKLINAIEITSFSICKDETKKNICGAYFENTDSNLIRVVTTDGYRLSIIDDNLGEKISQEEGFTIPFKALFELHKILIEKREEKEIRLLVNNKSILAKIGEIDFYIRLIEKKFPEYKIIIPLEGLKTIKTVISKDEIKPALRRMSIISNDNNKPVIFNFKGDILELFTEDNELGSVKEILKLKERVKEEFNFCINCNFLFDILNVVGKDIIIELNNEEENKPIIVKPINEKNMKYIIMPMIIN
jgi:DNA polymerase-3 subunit beta